MNLDPTRVTNTSQKFDSEVGLIMPWYTHPALEFIAKWDLAAKRVLEWGGGFSTLWWAAKARCVFTIESHQEWADWITVECGRRGFRHVTVSYRWPEPLADYLYVPADIRPDIVAVDGSERTECLRRALELPRPIVLICDNWQQDYVYLDEEAVKLMAPYPGDFFVQPDHTDHEGRPWQTAIWHVGAQT